MIGWKKIPLGDVITLQRGYDLPCQLRRHGVVPVISSAGTSDWHDKAMVTPPGVVTGRYGTIGKLFFIQEPFWPLNTTLYVKNFHGNEPRYIYYLLQLFDFNIFSGKSGVPGVNRNDIHAELVCIPNSIEEQQAIVGVLSDADAFIDALEQCITKKRHIKQGAMQELLTGKRRLPGFKGEWDKKTLDFCVTTSSGGTPPRNNAAYFLGNIPWVTTSELNDSDIKETNENISEAGLACSAAKIFPENTVLMAMYGATIGKLGIILNAAATNQACCAFLCDEIQIHYRWLYYFLLSKRVEIVSLGCGAGQPNISQEIIKKILLYLPLIDEQTAIAAVLTAMDDEIAALEAKLSKAKQIKAGMMQELLTGRTRLV